MYDYLRLPWLNECDAHLNIFIILPVIVIPPYIFLSVCLWFFCSGSDPVVWQERNSVNSSRKSTFLVKRRTSLSVGPRAECQDSNMQKMQGTERRLHGVVWGSTRRINLRRYTKKLSGQKKMQRQSMATRGRLIVNRVTASSSSTVCSVYSMILSNRTWGRVCRLLFTCCLHTCLSDTRDGEFLTQAKRCGNSRFIY